MPVRVQNNETFTADRVIMNYNLQNPEDERFPLAPQPYYTAGGKTFYMTDGQYADLARLTGETASASLDGMDFNVDKPTLYDVEWINDSVSESRGVVRDKLKDLWAGKDVKIDPVELGREIQQSMKQSVVLQAIETLKERDEYKDEESYEKQRKTVLRGKAKLNWLDLSHFEAQKLLFNHYSGSPKMNWKKFEALGKFYGKVKVGDTDPARDEIMGPKDKEGDRPTVPDEFWKPSDHPGSDRPTRYDTEFGRWMAEQGARWTKERKKK